MPKVSRIHRNTKHIYDSIDRAIRLHNYRQEDIGKELGIAQNTVSYHLKHHSFDQDQLNDLLDFLELEVQICAKSV